MFEDPSTRCPPALHLHAQTHAGFVRSRNEDAHGLLKRTGVAILADGLGGGRAGDVASAMAVAIISEALGAATLGGPCAEEPFDERRLLQHEQALRAAVADANEAIYRQALTHASYDGMGTTLVVAHWCGPQQLLIGHVGDSRAYRVLTQELQVGPRMHRRYELHPLTRDHTTAQREADERLASNGGGTGRASGMPPRLTRALGVEPEVVLELHRHRLSPGELVLLCSDGLTDMLDESRIEAMLNAEYGESPLTPADLPALSQTLVDAALEAGGRDNITVILGLQTFAAQEQPSP